MLLFYQRGADTASNSKKLRTMSIVIKNYNKVCKVYKLLTKSNKVMAGARK